MSSSSALTNATDPPTGWSNKEAYMCRSYYWAGKSGDIKAMLNTDYGLRNAVPVWTHLPQYGNVLFIFQAVPNSGKTAYYVWNGIEHSICHIDAVGIDEIRATINKLGEGKGYLKGLKLEVVHPPSVQEKPRRSLAGRAFGADHLAATFRATAAGPRV